VANPAANLSGVYANLGDYLTESDARRRLTRPRSLGALLGGAMVQPTSNGPRTIELRQVGPDQLEVI